MEFYWADIIKKKKIRMNRTVQDKICCGQLMDILADNLEWLVKQAPFFGTVGMAR